MQTRQPILKAFKASVRPLEKGRSDLFLWARLFLASGILISAQFFCVLYLFILNAVLLYLCPQMSPDSHRLIFYELNWHSPMLPLKSAFGFEYFMYASHNSCLRTVISSHKWVFSADDWENFVTTIALILMPCSTPHLGTHALSGLKRARTLQFDCGFRSTKPFARAFVLLFNIYTWPVHVNATSCHSRSCLQRELLPSRWTKFARGGLIRCTQTTLV